MATGSPPMHYQTPMLRVRITSCIQKSSYLQFDPRLLELPSLTLYRPHNLYIHLYLEITSPTERFRFVSQFYGREFPATRYQTLIPHVLSIHLQYETWVIHVYACGFPGRWSGRFHVHLYLYITSSTDRRSFS
jgi:hypothetical protein